MNQDEKNTLSAAVGSRLLHHLLSQLASMPAEKRAEARGFVLPAAVSVGWAEAVERLLGEGVGEDALAEGLRVAASLGHEALVCLLLSHGAPVNGTPSQWETPLAAAIEAGQVAVVRRLLAAGADPNLTPQEEEVPPLCDIRSWVSDGEIVRLLLAAGAEVNPSAAWRSPLDCAVADFESGEEPLEAVRLLLEAGAEVNSVGGYDDEIPLHTAARFGHSRIVALLLEHGAALNTADGEGNTPLFNALENGHEEAARLLLAAGADRACLDGATGAYLLQHAASDGALETVKLLVELGVPPGARIAAGQGGHALTTALSKGHGEVARYLLSEWREPLDTPDNHTNAWRAVVNSGRLDMARLLLAHSDNPASRFRARQAARRGAEDTGVPRRPLHLSCQDAIFTVSAGQVGMLRLLLDAGVAVEATEGSARTLLMQAARCGQVEMLRLLLARGARVDAVDVYGWTPLMHAVGYFRDEAAELLLAAGAERAPVLAHPRTAQAWAVMRGDESLLRSLMAGQEVDNFRRDVCPLRTPLMEAVCRGRLAIVRQLLEAGAPARPRDEDYREPLHHAARLGHADCIPLLLAHGARLSIKAEGIWTEGSGYTPLQEAVQAGQKEAVLALLQAGANVNGGEEASRCPLILALKGGQADMASLLLERGATVERSERAENDPLVLGAELGDAALMQQLLARCPQVQALREGDMTPLMAAAQAGHAEVVSLLLARGDADLEAMCSNRSTALMLAAERGHLVVVRQLLHAGARVDSDVLWGKTALCCAASHGHAEVVSLLLARGAAVNAGVLSSCETPLMRAAAAGYENVVRLLLRAGARVDVPSRLFGGPLSLAASKGHVAAMRLLLAAGAGVEQCTLHGNTVLCCAASGGQPAAVRLLLDCGAEVEAAGEDGMTPLLLAAAWGNADTVQVLLEAGANAYAVNIFGRDALALAERQKKRASAALLRAWMAAHPEAEKLMKKNHYGEMSEHDVMSGDLHREQLTRALCRAAEQGDAEAVSRLLAEGAELDGAEMEELGPLVEAASAGQVEVLRLLLEEGDKRQHDWGYECFNALEAAAEANSLDAVRLLLEEGRAADTPSLGAELPLWSPLRYGNTEMMQLMLDRGADINHPMPASDETLLVYAVREGFPAEMLRFLLEHGADLNAKDHREMTALMHAADVRNHEALRMLVEAGADLYAVSDEWCDSVMGIIAGQGEVEMARFLHAHGWCAQKEKSPCLYLAGKSGSRPMVDLLLEWGMKRDV